jgi:hypothetical protein
LYDDFQKAYSAAGKDHNSEIDIIPSTQLIVLLGLSASFSVPKDKVYNVFTEPFADKNITRDIFVGDTKDIRAENEIVTESAYVEAKERLTAGEFVLLLAENCQWTVIHCIFPLLLQSAPVVS